MPRLLHLWLLHTPSISVKMWYVFLCLKACLLKLTESRLQLSNSFSLNGTIHQNNVQI